MKQPDVVTILGDRQGSDTLILFMPGISGSNGQWMGIVGELSGFDADFGFSSGAVTNSAFGDGAPAISTVAHVIGEKLLALGYKSVVLVAHSVGAFVALSLANALPRLVTGVVITNGGLSSAGRFLDRPLRELATRPRSCLLLMRLFVLVSVPTPASLRTKIAKNQWLSRTLLGSFVSDSAIADVQARTALVESSNRPDVLPGIWKNRHHWQEFLRYAGQIQTRVVFAVGDRDPMSTVRDTQEMAALLPHAEVVVLNGVGHAAPLEARDVITDLIRSAATGRSGGSQSPAGQAAAAPVTGLGSSSAGQEEVRPG